MGFNITGISNILEIGPVAAYGQTKTLMDKAPPYVEKIPFDPARIQPTSTTYIYCSQSDFRNMTRMAEHKIATDR